MKIIDMKNLVHVFDIDFPWKSGNSGALQHTIFVVIAVMLLSGRTFAQAVYETTKGHASFFAAAPIADVDAHNQNVKATLNTSTNEVSFVMAMGDFIFKNAKMGRDAEKKYIETAKYPKASFKGKITGKIDYNKPGRYPATAKGKLTIHGVEKEIAENGTVTVLKNKIKLESQFQVSLADYEIEIPEILGKKMTEDHVLVKIDATLSEDAADSASKK